jgi:exonuclease SbcD
MSIQVVHVSDIHFGSGEGHGRINPETGLNIRFEDFVAALSKVVDFTIQHGCDMFLFSGDAYRNASPEPLYQKMFARELKRLSDAGIKTILLVGNHDQILKSTASHAMSVFQSLEVPGVITIDRPAFMRIDTKNGPMQLIGLPHVTRNQLLTAENYLGLPAASVDRVLADHLDALLKGFYDELDSSIPTVVTAHMTVDRAIAGIEQELLIGYTLTFPADIFYDDRIDYVALGHVHKHQTIREQSPAVVYAGSLERVDFGEQDEDKGFVHVQLERCATTWQFHSIGPRPFVTVDADLTGSERITESLIEKISKKILPGCVLRIRYKLKEEQLAELDENRLRNAAASALSVRLQPSVVQPQNRARLPQLTEAAVLSPLNALDTYLSEVAPERKDQLLKRASELINRLHQADSD